MVETAINFGLIVLLIFIFYYVVKNAVKNGINHSMLFSDKLREAQQKREAEKTNVAKGRIDKEV